LAAPILSDAQMATLTEPQWARYDSALTHYLEARTELRQATLLWRTCLGNSTRFQTYLGYYMPEVYAELLAASRPAIPEDARVQSNTIGGMALRTRLGGRTMIAAYLCGIALFMVLYTVL
jgi:hypothetical protein